MPINIGDWVFQNNVSESTAYSTDKGLWRNSKTGETVYGYNNVKSKADSKSTSSNEVVNLGKISDRIQSAANTISKVKSKLDFNSVYSLWISFTVGDTTICTGGTSYDLSSNVITNLMMSLEFVKNGSCMANSFTLTIAYTPDILNVSKSNIDVNFIDALLAGSNRKCKLQYGYVLDGEIILSPVYESLIVDYSVSIENQILEYEIKGYSNVTIVTEKLFSFPLLSFGSSESDGDDDGDSSGTKGIKVADSVAANDDTIIMDFSSLENSTDGIDPIEVARYVLDRTVGKNSIYKDKIKLNKEYTISVDENVKANKLETINAMSNVTIFEYVNTLLSLATELDTTNDSKNETNQSGSNTQTNTTDNSKSNTDDSKTSNIDEAEKVVFDLDIDDSNGSITIYKYDPKSSDGLQSIDIVFDMLDMGNTIVKSFSTQFKGAVLMALVSSRSCDEANEDEKPTLMDENGQYTEVDSINNTPVGDTKPDELIESRNWAKSIHHCYKATLETMGIPAEIPMTTKFTIKPMIYGQEHHTGGVYTVTKVTDSLSSSGYSSTFELMKLNSTEVKDFRKSIESTVGTSVKSNTIYVDSGYDPSTGLHSGRRNGVYVNDITEQEYRSAIEAGRYINY